MYAVIWEIDIEAGSHEEAARMARKYQRNPHNMCGVFDVTGPDGKTKRIDLDEVPDDEQDEESTPAEYLYGYYVNLDERGEFSADVRDHVGDTLFSIYVTDIEDSIFTDGFMDHPHDIEGLESYLKDQGVIHADGELLEMSEFENRIG